MSKPSTKQRILDATLMLFNTLGTPTVSTNHVALELGISPGNLYYHYKNKDQLIEQLFAQYEEELRPLLKQTSSEQQTIEDIWFFLHLGFELALQYRFIYQDTDYIISKCPSLGPKYRRVLEKLNDTLLHLLKQLSLRGTLAVSSETLLRDLGLTMLLICTQWISFKQHFSATSETGLTGDDLSQGVYQALSLLLPYLDPAHQAHLNALREEYR
ncbi:MAG: TetR/AcrR family transcriptional regulator [Porticoccaceae bacterium]|nr:TetR/AcrR family transcriptional regulator [Porticoccaceae bacterium]